MPTVAELDIQIDAKDDATGTILKLDALLKSLEEGKTEVEIDADASDADDAIAELKTELDALSDENINIDADTGDAEDAIAKIDEELNALSDETVSIEVDTSDAESEVATLEAEISSLNDETVSIEVDADAAGAIARLEAQLAAIPDETVNIKVDVDKGPIDDAEQAMDRLGTTSNRASGNVSGLVAAVLLLIPALIPIGAVAVGGIAALATQLSIAGIAAGLFGAVAVSVFSPIGDAIKKMGAAQLAYNQATTDKQRDAALAKLKGIMDSLTPSQQAMVVSIQAFQAAWRSFADQFEPEIFMIASDGLKAVASLLPSLAPIVRGAADAFLMLERSAIAALQGPFWQGFISMLGTQAEPMLESFGKSIGNIITGFAGIISAFVPLTISFSGGMEKMTGAFADWATHLSTNKSFQDFVEYIRSTTPSVLNLIGALATGFVALVRALAPLGAAIVVVVTALLRGIEALSNFSPALTIAIFAMAGLIATFLAVVGPITAVIGLVESIAVAFGVAEVGAGLFASTIALITSPITLVIAAIAALVVGLIYAYTHFQSFHDGVNAVVAGLVSFAETVYNAVVAGLTNVANWLSSTFGPVISTVVGFVISQFNQIRDWASQNAGTFQAAWNNIVAFFQIAWDVIKVAVSAGLAFITGLWNTVWPGMLIVLEGVWVAIKAVITAALQIIEGAILIWAGLISGHWSVMWDGLLLILQGVWTLITGLIQASVTVIIGIIVGFGAVLLAAWNLVWAGLSAAASTAWAAITGVITAAVNGIVAGLTAAWNTIQTITSTVWNAILATLTTIWNAIVAGLTAAWNTAQQITTTVWNAIQTVLTTIWNAIVAGLTAALATMLAAVTAGWNAIQAVTTAVWNAIVAGLTAAWNTIKALVTAAMAAIQAAITAGWAAIQAAISAAMSAIQSLITAAWNAITALIRAAMTTVTSAVTTGFSNMLAAARSGMSNIVSAVTSGFVNAVSAVASGVSQMVSAIESAAGRFFSAGASLMSNFVSGILPGIGNAVGAVKNAVGQITSLLPGSPAETGPLSGQGWTQIRGEHFSEDLAAGIAGRSNLVGSAARDLADLMTLQFSSSAAFDQIANAGLGATSPASRAGAATIQVAPGAVQVTVGSDASAVEVKDALSSAGDQLAEKLLNAIQRR